MKVFQTNFFGDVNLGMYARVSDKICVVGSFLSEKISKEFTRNLEAKILKMSIASTDLVGLFSVMNSNGIILPSIVADDEIRNLKSQTDLNVSILRTKFTAIGNLILANDRGALISRNFQRKHKELVEDTLGVQVEFATIADMSTIGSCGVATSKGCLVHRDATEEEVRVVQEILKVDTDIGNANFGSPFVGSCILANGTGALVGSSTTGPEVARIMETLGYI